MENGLALYDSFIKEIKNLIYCWRMRTFYFEYTQTTILPPLGAELDANSQRANLQPSVAEIQNANLKSSISEIDATNLAPSVREIEKPILPPLVAEIFVGEDGTVGLLGLSDSGSDGDD